MFDSIMNRRQAIALMAASGSILFSVSAGACVIRFPGRVIHTDSAGRVTFTTFIELDHRRCVISLPPACINLEARQLTILKQSGWQKIKSTLYRNQYQVQLTARQGSLRIWRDCAKKGISEGEIIIRVVSR